MPKRLLVAYQGEAGAYSEQASVEYFLRASPEESPSYKPCATFPDVLKAVSSGLADRAVLPIENSLAGTIHSNLDDLLAHPGLHIVGEHDFRVRHCLLALPGTKLEDITVVRSHFMALAQCTGFLTKRNLVSEVAKDTAGSAARVRRENIVGGAAIASRRAAELYDLDVLAESIEDEKENYTRFLILARTEVPACRPLELPAKTSIVFTLINRPGALYRALSVFTVLDIDLTKIESRHVHTVLNAVSEIDKTVARRWGYVFYVDFARSFDEMPVQNALSNLQQITPFYRLLGSYTRHTHPEDDSTTTEHGGGAYAPSASVPAKMKPHDAGNGDFDVKEASIAVSSKTRPLDQSQSHATHSTKSVATRAQIEAES